MPGIIKIVYVGSFLQQLLDLPKDLREEAIEKIELFTNRNNHKFLRVHKLKGKLKHYFSFSVNYKTRILFTYVKNEAYLITIGDHEIYK